MKVCTCGHNELVHQHYRSGFDCSICGREKCRQFRDAKGIRQRLASLFKQKRSTVS